MGIFFTYKMASKYLQKYPVPEEFPDLLHDFAREVLRDQPDNIYEYGALYFKHMYMGTEFDYKNKGKSIPPPRDRLPDTQNYYEMEPSPDAHMIQDAPEQYMEANQMTEAEYAAALQ